jgi:hypothetical protein
LTSNSKTLKPTLNQKRFLIIWTLINSFALFVNLAYLRGELDTPTTTIYLFTSGEKSGFWPFTSYSTKEDRIAEVPNLIPDIPKTRYLKPEDAIKFAASSDPNKAVLSTDSIVTDFSPIITRTIGTSHSYIGGLFNSYGIPEYIFYMCLGLGIIFLPKSWKHDTSVPST